MPMKTPDQISDAAVEAGTKKARLGWDKALVGGFLAGAYIAFGGLVAIAVSSGLSPETWGTLPTLFAGSVFALGLVLVVVAGSELLTGNMALVPLAAFRGRVSLPAIGLNFTIVRLAAIAQLKGGTETEWQIFLRALGCNWLVCLAVWVAMSAEDTGGKILGIFFPIMAFVAIGFDHVVANMFFLPAAIFADVPGIGWGDALHNWIFAFLGNLVGASVFVASAYWYLHLKDKPDEPGGSAGGEQTTSGNGRATPSGRGALGSTRWSMRTSSPTRHDHERGRSTAVIRTSTGTTPSRRAAPMSPERTSASPRPHAPCKCGAHSGQACGRAIRFQALAGDPFASAVQVGMNPVPTRDCHARWPM